MLLSRFFIYSIKTTKIKPNQYDFLDLVRAPIGSQITITPQEKQKINQQIDKKLQQLQDTGLSRQEILLSKSQKGLPLAIDPFFQFIKRNKLARQVYLKKNDRFTMEKIVDIALRQDIGPDPSYSRSREEGLLNEKGRAELMNDLKQRQRKYFNPTSYYANFQTNTAKLEDQLKPHQPLRHIYKPIQRYQRMKIYQKKLKKYDIHWRNVELLRQFITPYGSIKNRFANRLSPSDQKKINMAIKTARHYCALPFYGRTLNPNKRNLTSLEQQVKQIGLQNVNLQTGQIYFSRPTSMDNKQLQKQNKSDTDWRYQQMLKGNNYQLWIDTLEQPQDQQLIEAQRYARYLKNQQLEKRKDISHATSAVNLRKLALRKLTGIQEQQDILVELDQSQKAKQSFQKRKKFVQKKVSQDVLSFSKIILGQKTLL